MTKKTEFEKTGMVIFPMQYIENDNYLKAYIIGKTLSGEVIAMFVHPNPDSVKRAENNSSSTIPLVETFADEGRKARLPCEASEDNSKNSPYGILLCEQVTKGKEFLIELNGEKISVQAYKCVWASVLREDDEMPKPAIGLGYVEVGYAYGDKESSQSFQSIQNQIKEYFEINNNPNISPLDKASVLQRKYEEITVNRKKMFAAVSIKHREIVENVQTYDMASFRQLIEKLAYKWCGNGRYGMVTIRVRNGNTILSKASTRFVTGYNYKEKRILTNDENWDGFMKYEMKHLSKWLNRNDISIDLIPAQRINYAYHGMEKCSKDFCQLSPHGALKPATKMMKLYIDKDFHFRPDIDLVRNNGFLASWVGVRMAEVRQKKSKQGGQEKNEIASSIHAFSKVFGNALEVTSDLQKRYYMDFKQTDMKNERLAG
jgi:hypothetical protein